MSMDSPYKDRSTNVLVCVCVFNSLHPPHDLDKTANPKWLGQTMSWILLEPLISQHVSEDSLGLKRQVFHLK